MSDQQQKTAQRQVREQLQAAEGTTQTVLHAWSDITETMTGQTAALVERNLQLTDELASQISRAMQDGRGIWLRLVHDSFNIWQDYLQAIAHISTRNAREVVDSANRSAGHR